MRIDNIVNRGRLPAPKRTYLGGALLLAMVVATVLLLSGPGDGASAAGTNDSFAKATVIASLPFTTTQNNAGYTTEVGEPLPCGLKGATAWFKLTVTGDTNVVVDTGGSAYDTVLAVYNGAALNTLTLMSCTNNVTGVGTETVGFLARPGVTYYIQAGGASGAAGSLTLNASGSVKTAGSPTVMNYQGRLTTTGGSPVADGNYTITFRIFNQENTLVWTETQNVAVAGGLFNVRLGSKTALTAAVFNGSNRFLEVQVVGDPAMTPRQRLASVPYALRAQVLQATTGAQVEEISDGWLFTLPTGTASLRSSPSYGDGSLFLDGQGVFLNENGPEADSVIEIFDDGVSGNEELRWNDLGDNFQFTNDLWAPSFNVISDRNAKANLADVDERQILDRLAEVPIETWNFKDDKAAARHVGPTAQDFSAVLASLGVSTDDKTINLTDANGVALASIQALYEQVQEKDARIDALAKEKDAEIEALSARLDALEGKTGSAPASQSAVVAEEGSGTPWLVIALAAAALVLIPSAALLGRAAARRARS